MLLLATVWLQQQPIWWVCDIKIVLLNNDIATDSKGRMQHKQMTWHRGDTMSLQYMKGKLCIIQRIL